MSLVTVLLAPLALLLPAAGAVEPLTTGGSDLGEIAPPPQESEPERLAVQAGSTFQSVDPGEMAAFQQIAQGFQVEPLNQVRIEQRVTIRITPRAAAPQTQMLVDLPTRTVAPRLVERDAGHCLPIAGIAGVQATDDNRLLLYMRDRRVISAGLERSCSARDYYSGFYVERNADGQICVKRDTLLSRSGANCKLSRIRQLVPGGN